MSLTISQAFELPDSKDIRAMDFVIRLREAAPDSEETRKLVADYVVTQPQIHLAGRRIARGTGAGLVLWRTGGAVRLADPRLTTGALMTAYCG